jgi:hypothetical protein
MVSPFTSIYFVNIFFNCMVNIWPGFTTQLAKDAIQCEDIYHYSSIIVIIFQSVFGFQQESVEATAEVSKTFNEKIRKYCDMTLLSCAYAGTGNVLKVFCQG